MAVPFKNKSGLSITNGFKIVLSENPQKIENEKSYG